MKLLFSLFFIMVAAVPAFSSPDQLILLPLITVEFIAGCPQFEDGTQAGTVQSSLVNEASGIAASRKNPNVLWVHNDSGDSARAFAMNTEGTHLGVYNLSGAGAADWEDIAIGPGPVDDFDYLYCGDIGDNYAVRSYITVYRVIEPQVDSEQSPVNVNLTGVESITLQYPDGARDAETLMVDPVTKDIYIISKRETYSRVYLAAYPQSTTSTITMEYKGQLPWGWAVGGDISPDGSLVIVRGYTDASIWQRGDGVNLWEIFTGTECSVSILSEPQGEAICFDADGCGYYTVSENLYQPIYYFARNGQCPLLPPTADFDGNGNVDLADFAKLAFNWLDTGCESPLWCNDTNLNMDGTVDENDLLEFVSYWLTDPALRVYLKLDESSGDIAFDSSGYDYNGTLVNFPADNSRWIAGQVGGALHFDGLDDYVQVTGYKGVTGSQSRTVTAWIKTSTNGSIISWGTASGDGQKWLIRLDPANGALRTAVQGGSIVSSTDISDSKWYHIAAVLDDDGTPDVSEIKLYVDGIEESYSSILSQAIDTAAGSDVVLGAIDGSGYFDGDIDDVRIYDRALSSAEIENLAQ